MFADFQPLLSGIAPRLVPWQRLHGRRLPWSVRDPYRVWLSEVMLQQTQVGTVLAYYARFLQRFPTVQCLASASLDSVLALWSGLGYYSRARNLHLAAQQVVNVHAGFFPRTAVALQALPGVGRSTAAAVAAFCFDERTPILDANVKRVLCRVLAFGGDMARKQDADLLWAFADAALPAQAADMPAYTQGLMDVGAGLCKVRNPQCGACPLADICRAQQQGSWAHFPVKKTKTERQSLDWWLLCIRAADGRIFMQRRPAPGIWAGLYAFPLFGSRAALFEQLQQSVQGFEHSSAPAAQEFAPVTHVLTHRLLQLHFVLFDLTQPSAPEWPELDGGWFAPQDAAQLGLPAPVARWLENL